jgi:hypothetical protein
VDVIPVGPLVADGPAAAQDGALTSSERFTPPPGNSRM